MGHAHDPVGALAAAVAYAQFAEAAVGNSVDDVVAAQEAMASDASRAALVASTRQKLEALYAVYPPDSLSYRVAVVAAKVTIVDPDSCRIDLWQVTVLGVVNGPTREDWSTLTYGLVWERGDWRVASEVTAPGPYPAPWPQVTPTLPDELAARLAGFGPIGADR
jgi:hypothetical protein